MDVFCGTNICSMECRFFHNDWANIVNSVGNVMDISFRQNSRIWGLVWGRTKQQQQRAWTQEAMVALSVAIGKQTTTNTGRDLRFSCPFAQISRNYTFNFQSCFYFVLFVRIKRELGELVFPNVRTGTPNLSSMQNQT